MVFGDVASAARASSRSYFESRLSSIFSELMSSPLFSEQRRELECLGRVQLRHDLQRLPPQGGPRPCFPKPKELLDPVQPIDGLVRQLSARLQDLLIESKAFCRCAASAGRRAGIASSVASVSSSSMKN